ncbi:hypothetical protein SUGI_0467060 [Cryptomeria japonica]|nr:hypothetical protein SUGI_0467060 [Cryptomeria japonica]
MTIVLYDKRFGAFSDGFRGGKSPHLLFKGDLEECVWLIPMFFQDIGVPLSRVLCNLAQPILALLSIFSGNAATDSEVVMNRKSVAKLKGYKCFQIYCNSRGKGGGVIKGLTSEVVLVSLLAARDKVLKKIGAKSLSKLVVYVSDQTHSSIEKACRDSKGAP